MGLFTYKTNAVDTSGLNFSKLKEKIDEQVAKKKLEGDAQLRFRAGKGLYAKSETWNVNRFDPFGSGAVERGGKFRAAREEVARSINLSYANQQVNGMFVGHYVIDQILDERAREQLGLPPRGHSVREDPEVEKRVENLKASLHLKYSDINEIAKRITNLKKSGAIHKDRNIQLHKGQVPDERLLSSIGHLRGPGQTDEAAERETRKLIEVMTSDLVEHKWSRAMSPEDREALRASENRRDQEKYNELEKKFNADAEEEARTMLSHSGMKTYYRGHMEEEEELHALPGGLSQANVAKMGLLLRLWGIKDDNTALLLQSTGLPKHITGCGARLADLKTQMEQRAIALHHPNIVAELAHRIGKDAAENIDYQFRDLGGDIQALVDENRAAVLSLKEMSFPDDVTDPVVRRQHYNRLIYNIEQMDDVLERLNTIVSSHDGVVRNVAGGAAADLVDAAQKFCTETLELAGGVYPGPVKNNASDVKPDSQDREDSQDQLLSGSDADDASLLANGSVDERRRRSSDADYYGVPRLGDEIANRQRPFHLHLPGLMLNSSPGDIEHKIINGLGNPIETPWVLFERDTTDMFSTGSLTRGHNARMLKISHGYNDYKHILKTHPSLRTKEDNTYINRFRKNLIKALQDNERLTEIFQRRQEVRGDAPHADIDAQLARVKEQRNALLLLLYPRLTRPAPDWSGVVGVDQGLMANDSDRSLNAPQQGQGGRGAIEEEDDSNNEQIPTLGQKWDAPIAQEFRTPNDDELSYSSDSLIEPEPTPYGGTRNFSNEQNHLIDNDDREIATRGGLGADIILEYFIAPGNGDEEHARQRFDVVDNPQSIIRAQEDALQDDADPLAADAQGIAGVNHDPKFDFAEPDNAAWTSTKRQVALDLAMLSDVYEDDFHWLDRLDSNGFKKAERLQEGQKHIHEEVKAASGRNASALKTVITSLDDGSLAETSARNPAQEALWQSLGMRIKLNDKLIQFLATQRERRTNGDLSGSDSEKKLADDSISKVRTTLRNIDQLIAGTHSVAYALSSPEQRDSVKQGMLFYPRSLVVNTPLDILDKYPVFANNLKKLNEYAQAETASAYLQNVDSEYVSNQGLAKGFLASLNEVQHTLDDLKQVQSEAHRSARINVLENQLIPQLDNALKRNSDVSEMFKDKDFVENVVQEQIIAESDLELVQSDLKLVRSNLENLRLNALILLRGEALRQNAA